MKILITGILCFALANVAMAAVDVKPTPAKKANAIQELDLDTRGELEAWRERVGQSLKRDNGWLTLAGRFVMKPGANTFGTGANNDIVFPSELKGVGSDRLGVITVDEAAKTVTLTTTEGTSWTADGKPIANPRVLGTSTDKRDWVALNNIAMHVIERDGKYILRLADNKSAVRANFKGRLWYQPDAKFRVQAKYTPYPPGKTIAIVNVLDEVNDEPSPGFVEFKLNGVNYKLDAVGDGEGLFFVMRDKTSGDTTYRPSRFLSVEKKPEPNKPFWLDFNRAYNPPCAFSEFTTCPLPPKQNILRVRIEAGGKIFEDVSRIVIAQTLYFY
ncbi:MAG: DUF1684 domain-containing protein [Gammaproteobacteria bacterium]|nr:DUF1684 domain-containing protein [Gammaproteobacteria bacterium]